MTTQQFLVRELLGQCCHWTESAEKLGQYIRDASVFARCDLRVVAASGYFNPLHVGHVRYLQAARELGDILVVIVNNDRQVALKGRTPFMPEQERVEVVGAVHGVIAVLSEDDDPSVSVTLARIRPHIFANGGDVTSPAQVREKDVCKQLGIKLVFGVGGKKIQSSRVLVKGALG
jgi:cytidyltransferase-like protein